MLKFTREAITAINTAFDRGNVEQDREIELGLVKKSNLINYFFTESELSSSEGAENTHILVDAGKEATFRVYLPKELIKDYEDVTIDYILVYSEKDNQEGEVFRFIKENPNVTET